jgi:hypothetical protein
MGDLQEQRNDLQKEGEDLIQGIETLQEDVTDLCKKETDFENALTHLFHRLRNQCEKFESQFSNLIWEPAQPQELKSMCQLVEYNDKLRKEIEEMERGKLLGVQEQMCHFVALFAKHREWEFTTMTELLQISSKSDLAETAREQDSTKPHPGNEALMKTGAAIRLRFWQQSKNEHPWTLCEDFSQARCQSLIEAGNVAAHEPDVASDVALFTHCFLTREDNLKVFENMYGKDLEFCTRLIRRVPQFCTLLNAEAAVYLPNWREERDSIGWDE